MYTSIIGELEFIFQALGNLVAEGDLEDAIAERLLEMATQGHSTLVLAQSPRAYLCTADYLGRDCSI